MTSEYLSPTILSSRRLFGPNLFSAAPGAVLDVACTNTHARLVVERWTAEAQHLAAQVGWSQARTTTRFGRESASLFLEAPADGLLTASDLTEQAWVAAEWWQERTAEDDTTGAAITPNPHVIALLQRAYAAERVPLAHVTPLREYARAHGLVFSLDDESCAVGAGSGVFTLRHDESARLTPSARDLAARRARNVPTVLVTGSNGKTTTTRLIAAMAREAEYEVGWSCSDGVYMGGEQVAGGDYTGPGGARLVLNDRRVSFAVLEAARGGMLRRGLAINRADAAVITNISADHFGEYGIDTLDDLAQVKSIVARALPPDRPLTLNADDPTLVALGETLAADRRPIAWFSRGLLAEAGTRVEQGIARTDFGAILRDGQLRLCVARQWYELGAVADMPVTLAGHAAHNIDNALAAALTAAIAGVNPSAIRSALATFGGASADNPGRLMVRALGGITVILDYAHNPGGIAALCSTAASIPAKRRLLLFGQAGDRDDDQLRALAQMAWQTQRFDRVIIKEMVSMLRGRAVGELPHVLRDALLKAGAAPELVSIVDSEMHGVRDALAWARPGDVLVLGVHISVPAVSALLDRLAAQSWHAGDTLPAPAELP
jgi:cyanophycin synthetase